jgi:hypothetical protein
MQEYLTMEDLLLEVDEATPGRLSKGDENSFTVDALVPSILNGRNRKRRESSTTNNDLSTPLL